MKCFLFFGFFIFFEVGCFEIDDVCSIDGVEYGVVKEVEKCAHVVKLVREKKKDEVKRLNLSVDRNKLLFCCPTRKAFRVCKTFGNRPEEPEMISNRIINGKVAHPGEFPHFASLAYNVDGKVRFDCGASLISQNFVLTAAHCCSKKANLPIFVRLGKVGKLISYAIGTTESIFLFRPLWWKTFQEILL